MRKRNLPENESAKRVKREKDPIPWRYCFLTLIFGVLLVGGLFFAARIHFSAIDYGMKNGELRKKRDELEGEKRLITLAKEKSLSPPELEKRAKEIGLVKLTAQTVEVVSDAKESIENIKETAQKTFLPRNKEPKVDANEPKETKNHSEETKNSENKDIEKLEKTEVKTKDSDLKESTRTRSENEKGDKKDKINKPISKTGAK